MRYLIDTNVFIRVIEDYDVLENTKKILENYENIIYVSSESLKEFVHLAQTGKISLNKRGLAPKLFDFIENELGFKVKFIKQEHIQTFSKLDTVEGHNDPSDRLIIAQAITEKIPLISGDKKFPKYKKNGIRFYSQLQITKNR